MRYQIDTSFLMKGECMKQEEEMIEVATRNPERQKRYLRELYDQFEKKKKGDDTK